MINTPTPLHFHLLHLRQPAAKPATPSPAEMKSVTEPESETGCSIELNGGDNAVFLCCLGSRVETDFKDTQSGAQVHLVDKDTHNQVRTALNHAHNQIVTQLGTAHNQIHTALNSAHNQIQTAFNHTHNQVETALKHMHNQAGTVFKHTPKGKKEECVSGSVFSASLKGMRHVRSKDGEMLTKPFLDVCKNILPVIGKLGAATTLVKYDVAGYISRLESKYLSNPSEFNLLYNLVLAEVEAKTPAASSTCSSDLLWLTRVMDFLVELFRGILQNPDWTMSHACSVSYSKTLKKRHGWLTRSSFSVALKLAPGRKKFMAVAGGTSDLNSDIERFCANLSLLLEENHKILASFALDEIKAS